MRDVSISHRTVCLMHGLCLQAYSQWLVLSLLPGLDFLPVGRLGTYSSTPQEKSLRHVTERVYW